MKLRVPVLLLFVFGLCAFAAEKVEPAPAVPESVPATVRGAVDPRGFRVIGDDGPIADLWLRTSVPAASKKEAGAVVYPELASGTFVGVLAMPKGGGDFRGQNIPPGVYALRYELLPEDGNHMGVAPNRDFLLLVPVAADPGPTAQTRYDELVKLSQRVSGTQHPAVLALVPAKGTPQPSVTTNADGYVVLSAKMKTSTGNLPFSLVVKGQAAQ